MSEIHNFSWVTLHMSGFPYTKVQFTTRRRCLFIIFIYNIHSVWLNSNKCQSNPKLSLFLFNTFRLCEKFTLRENNYL